MNLILKKRLIEEVAGYDEALTTQYDTDLGIRILENGVDWVRTRGAGENNR